MRPVAPHKASIIIITDLQFLNHISLITLRTSLILSTLSKSLFCVSIYESVIPPGHIEAEIIGHNAAGFSSSFIAGEQ